MGNETCESIILTGAEILSQLGRPQQTDPLPPSRWKTAKPIVRQNFAVGDQRLASIPGGKDGGKGTVRLVRLQSVTGVQKRFPRRTDPVHISLSSSSYRRCLLCAHGVAALPCISSNLFAQTSQLAAGINLSSASEEPVPEKQRERRRQRTARTSGRVEKEEGGRGGGEGGEGEGEGEEEGEETGMGFTAVARSRNTIGDHVADGRRPLALGSSFQNATNANLAARPIHKSFGAPPTSLARLLLLHGCCYCCCCCCCCCCCFGGQSPLVVLSSSSSSILLPLITRRECGPLVSLAFRPMSCPLSHPAFDSCQLMSLFVQRLHGYLLKRSFLLPTASSNGFPLNPSPPSSWIDRWPRWPRWIGPRRRRIFRRTLRTRTTPRWRLSLATASRISPPHWGQLDDDRKYGTSSKSTSLYFPIIRHSIRIWCKILDQFYYWIAS